MRTVAALLTIWFAVGAGIMLDGHYRLLEARVEKIRQQAEVEKQQAIDRERAIAERNLHQAEVFIAMCLDPVHRYAYLGPLVFECKATETKHRLYF